MSQPAVPAISNDASAMRHGVVPPDGLSSNASGTVNSLVRRSRTRSRSRTLGGSSRPEKTWQKLSSLPSDGHVPINPGSETARDHSSNVFLARLGADQPPPLPQRSPRRSSMNIEEINEKLELIAARNLSSPASAETRRSAQADTKSLSDLPSSKTSKRGASLPRLTVRKAKNGSVDTTTSFPAAFPPPSEFPGSDRHMRESMMTQRSAASSSLYPASTSASTVSGTESPPSPRSLAQQDRHDGISSFDPEADAGIHELQGFDADDVSYRLRLLVKNNYFLPPAHAKPSLSDFTSPTLATPRKPSRAATPTFLDLFRVGKSKSKTASDAPPNHAGDHIAPILRTTSDSTTASGYVTRPQARSLPQSPLHSPHIGAHRERAGRVVVVREKMDDLVGAAKQAELDAKTRAGRREWSHGSKRGKQEEFDDIIDPTDAVDLPPPAVGYPFAVQASALHGLGVEESLGAALLAECLPPHSPGGLSLDPEEEAWRKALLQEAVGHSLHGSPATSSISRVPSSPTVSSRSPTSIVSPQKLGSSRMKRVLEQRILEPPVLEMGDEDSPSHSSRPRLSYRRTSPLGTRGRYTSPDQHRSSNSSFIPMRAETPAAPPTPLAPPPRKQIINPLYSLSQIDLPNENKGTKQVPPSDRPPLSLKMVRKAISTPVLSDTCEGSSRNFVTMTPPPVPILNVMPPQPYVVGKPSTSSLPSHLPRDSLSVYSQSSEHENDDILIEMEGTPSRPSMTLSLPTDGRPSFSEYSQPSPTASSFHEPSPTASAFYDTWSDGFRSAYSQLPHRSTDSVASPTSPVPRVPSPRYSTMSPPPRVSSSLSKTALSPPPRPGITKTKVISRASSSSPSVRASVSSSGHATPPPGPLAAIHQVLGPGPSPSPNSNHPRGSALPSLTIPVSPIPESIHSAPPPSSPTSFFDRIQAHPNAMDDLDSSDSEEQSDNDVEEDTATVFVNPETRTISSRPSFSSSRPSLMRLGNHSSPYVAHEAADTSPPLVELPDRRPIANVPPRATFFSKKVGKSEQGHIPISTFDFLAQGGNSSADRSTGGFGAGPSSRRRPATAGDANTRSWQDSQKAQVESLRKLDGMLVQHMETERDTIKRITSSLTKG